MGKEKMGVKVVSTEDASPKKLLSFSSVDVLMSLSNFEGSL